MSNDKGPIGLQTAEFCDPSTSAEITKLCQTKLSISQEACISPSISWRRTELCLKLRVSGGPAPLHAMEVRIRPESTWNVEEHFLTNMIERALAGILCVRYPRPNYPVAQGLTCHDHSSVRSRKVRINFASLGRYTSDDQSWDDFRLD